MTRFTSNAAVLSMIMLACAIARPATSDILFNNFGPGDTYNTGAGWTVSGPTSFAGYNTQGHQFSPISTAALDSIDVAMGLIFDVNHFDLALKTDAAGTVGADIETFSIDNQMGPFASPNPPIHIVSSSHPLLTAGTNYWLVESATGSTVAAWNFNSIGDTGPRAFSSNGGATYSISTGIRSAFRVNGAAAVPEPGAVAFLAAAGGLLLVGRKRRKL